MIKRSVGIAFCAVAFAATASAENLAVELSPAQMDTVTAGGLELNALATFAGFASGTAQGAVEVNVFTHVRTDDVQKDQRPDMFIAVARSQVKSTGQGAEQTLAAAAATETNVPDPVYGFLNFGVKASETITAPGVGMVFSFSTEVKFAIPAPTRVPYGWVSPF